MSWLLLKTKLKPAKTENFQQNLKDKQFKNFFWCDWT